MHDDVVRDLERARARTLQLTDLDEATLLAQHVPLMSPVVWEVAHIGQEGELWLLRSGDPARPGMLAPDVDSLYDAFKHRRADRPSLPLLPPVEARAYDYEVRGRVLDLLERTPEDDLFTAGMGVQHEEMHDETMLATLQPRQGPPVVLARRKLPGGRPAAGNEPVFAAGGPFVRGGGAPRGGGSGGWAARAAGLANLGGLGVRPAPIGAYPAGASAYGAEQMIGDVWEWTSSDFTPWPGFVPMIYRNYSEPFFGGDYKVLRGGAWAGAPSTVPPPLRDWGRPIRRQIFTRLRLAGDA